jgi:N-acetyl-anhydromuramyl-L-alanine amidase AmpD
MLMGYYLLDNRNPYGDHFYPSRRKPLRVIVLHITAGLEDLDLIGRDASAEQTARYCATTDRQVSWHAGADSDSWLNLLPASYTAWHASDYNSGSWGLEISKTDISWGDEPKAWVERTLTNAAAACRPVAAKYGIPHRLLTRAQVDAGMDGFTYHSRLDPTRRSDPGPDFPIARLFELLKGDWLAMATEAQVRAIVREEVADALRKDGVVSNLIDNAKPMSVVAALSQIHYDANRLREEHAAEETP